MKTDPVNLFIDAWKLITGRLPSPRFEESNGVTSCFCDVPNLFFNLWIQSTPAIMREKFLAVLATGAERASASANLVGGIIREDWAPSDWETLIGTKGLTKMVPMISMEAEDLLPPRRALADLEIRRIEDDGGATDLAMLNADAYSMPRDLWDCISNMRLWHPDSFGFVGYKDGVPVSSAATLPVLGTVYVALVATSPKEQGKGYAEAVMRRAVVEGQKAMGTKRTTLHASMMGHPLYKAMGYESGAPLALIGPDAH